MKVFILCGGHGTRLDNLGKIIAKPMARINKEPILLHIIENFLVQGFNEFVICTGHKSETKNNFFLKKILS
jgi:glucose-1-phosphate cytidylyltransferase